MISIGSLEKSANTFAQKLSNAGHEVKVKVHRSGPMVGCDTQRVSFVELTVGNRYVKFMANGYSAVRGSEIGDTFMTWGEMKAEAIDHLNLDAKLQVIPKV